MKKYVPLCLKIGMALLLATLLFAYTHLVQRELMVANNHGKLTIYASKKTTQGGDFYYQNIGRISINGRSLDTKEIKENSWTTYDVDVANVTYVANPESAMTIEHPNAIKSLSFEYQKHSQHGVIQIYMDDQLIKEIDTNSKKSGSGYATILTPQVLGIDSHNVFWYSMLTVFLLASLAFVSKELYRKINYRQALKFGLLSGLAMLSLSTALGYLNGDDVSIFTSNLGSGDLLLIALLTLFFIGISLVSLRAVLPGRVKQLIKWPYLLSYLFPPFLAFYLTENAYSSMTLLEGRVLVYNFFILLLIYLALSWITTSLKAGGSLLLILATAFGVLNKIMIDTRNQPLLFYHLLQLEDGLNVASKTSIHFDNAILQSIFLGWLGIAFLIFLPKVTIILPDRLSKTIKALPYRLNKPYVYRPLFGLLGLLVTAFVLPQIIIFTARQAKVDLNYWRLQATYAKVGSPLAMASFYEDGLIEKPAGYSPQAVSDILDTYQPSETAKDKQPNIIIIQNESQADFSRIKDLNLSSDPLAFQHSLKENTVHGSLNVSVYGGGTANTEYEVLTSNALTMLSNNVFPYQQLIDGKRNSLASLLKNHGYDTVAMHPQSSLNYNRRNVYEAFDFAQSYFLDSKPSINSLYQTQMERGFVSDKSLFEGVESLYSKKDKGSPLFTFLVTMQGHGGYASSHFENPVTVDGSAETYPEEAEYLSSLQSSDQAFKGLIDYFKTYDEPTLIVMYGDHQPHLSDNFYQNFMPETLGNNPDLSPTYTTPFVIWSNFDIAEKAPTTISPNFLVPYTMSLIKDSKNPLPVSPYYQFLSELQKKVPVATTWGFKTSEGKFHENLADEPLLKDYRMIEYNNAIDQNTLSQYFD